MNVKSWSQLTALFAIPISVMATIPSCSSDLPEATPNDDWTLEEEADIFEEDADIEPSEPDESIPDPTDEHWTPSAAGAPTYSCPACDEINCASSTYDRRANFGKRPIKADTHLYGGTGNDRGKILEASVLLNCGIRKQLDIDGLGGVKYPALYVWNTIAGDGTRVSGWIRESALEQKISMKTRNNPARRFNHKVYRFAGPEVAADLARKYDSPGKYYKLRIAAHGGVDDNLLAHYMTRKDSFGNWGVNVTQGVPGQGNGPGHANDTYTISSDPAKNPKATGTHPSTLHAGEATSVKVLIYTAKTKDSDSSTPWTGCGKSRCYATFVYVKVRGRYGWMPRALFTKKVIGIAASVPPDGGSACGAEGAECCAGGGCDPGLVCNGTTCVGCGAVGEPCCPGDGCVDGICSGGSCVNCGALGESCCPGSACDQGICDGATCVGCGNAGEICCNGACASDRLNCNGACQPCGDLKQPCCASGAQCNASTCFGGTCGIACYARCIDGTLQGAYPSSDTTDCTNWSNAACAGHSGTGRIEFNYNNIYDSGVCGAAGQMCCAADKCNTGLTCSSGPLMYQKTCR